MAYEVNQGTGSPGTIKTFILLGLGVGAPTPPGEVTGTKLLLLGVG